MASYNPASSLFNGGKIDAGAIVTELQSLSVSHVVGYDSADFTSTSATFSTIASASLAVEADEVVLVCGYVHWSASVANEEVSFDLLAGGNSIIGIAKPGAISAIASSTGRAQTTFFFGVHEPSADGSVLYELDWSNLTETGTLYTESEVIAAFAFKKD